MSAPRWVVRLTDGKGLHWYYLTGGGSPRWTRSQLLADRYAQRADARRDARTVLAPVGWNVEPTFVRLRLRAPALPAVGEATESALDAGRPGGAPEEK